MRPDLPSRFVSKIITSDTTLTTHDIALYGLFVASTAGVAITLPIPHEAMNGAESLIVNHSASTISVNCLNGFANSLDSITLAAGASILLYCAEVSGNTYRWAVVGATPS
jgi:hypothetical protein